MRAHFWITILPFLAGLAAALPVDGASTVSSMASTISTTVTAPTPLPFDDDVDADVGGDEGTFEEEGQSAVDEVSLPIAEGPLEKRKLPTSLRWVSHPNVKFKVGKNVNVKADVTFSSNGKVRVHTEVNNRRRWGPYKYAVACTIKDKAGRLYTIDRTGSVCRRGKACHLEVKDKTVTNKSVKNNWKGIVEGPRSLTCGATATWNVGKVIDWISKWIKKHKGAALAVIAIMSAVF